MYCIESLTWDFPVVLRYSEGRQPGHLPEWSQKGAVVGLEGGTLNVSQEVGKMLDFGIPITGVWLQDWVGLRHSWDGGKSCNLLSHHVEII